MISLKQRSCKLSLFLWLLTSAYALWLLPHAYQELNEEYKVEGLFRSYERPHALSEGWLLDPRPGDLLEELLSRYRPGSSALLHSGPLPKDPQAWAQLLERYGLESRLGHGLGRGLHPRLIFTAGGPWLLISLYLGRPVVFDPQRGLIFLKERVLQERPALILFNAKEAPW